MLPQTRASPVPSEPDIATAFCAAVFFVFCCLSADADVVADAERAASPRCSRSNAMARCAMRRAFIFDIVLTVTDLPRTTPDTFSLDSPRHDY